MLVTPRRKRYVLTFAWGDVPYGFMEIAVLKGSRVVEKTHDLTLLTVRGSASNSRALTWYVVVEGPEPKITLGDPLDEVEPSQMVRATFRYGDEGLEVLGIPDDAAEEAERQELRDRVVEAALARGAALPAGAPGASTDPDAGARGVVARDRPQAARGGVPAERAPERGLVRPLGAGHRVPREPHARPGGHVSETIPEEPPMTESAQGKPVAFVCYFCGAEHPPEAAECEHVLPCGCSYDALVKPITRGFYTKAPWLGGEVLQRAMVETFADGEHVMHAEEHPLKGEAVRLCRAKAVVYLQSVMLRREEPQFDQLAKMLPESRRVGYVPKALVDELKALPKEPCYWRGAPVPEYPGFHEYACPPRATPRSPETRIYVYGDDPSVIVFWHGGTSGIYSGIYFACDVRNRKFWTYFGANDYASSSSPERAVRNWLDRCDRASISDGLLPEPPTESWTPPPR